MLKWKSYIFYSQKSHHNRVLFFILCSKFIKYQIVCWRALRKKINFNSLFLFSNKINKLVKVTNNHKYKYIQSKGKDSRIKLIIIEKYVNFYFLSNSSLKYFVSFVDQWVRTGNKWRVAIQRLRKLKIWLTTSHSHFLVGSQKGGNYAMIKVK